MKARNRLNRILYTLIQLSWGALQNICGILLFVILFLKNPKRKVFYYHGAIVSHWDYPYSMGLGMFIFFGHHTQEKRYANAVLVHEYGHTIQSCILGPFFLFVIGIPSCVWNYTPKFQQWRKEGRFTYYDFYPEGWANLAGKRVLKRPAPKKRLADMPHAPANTKPAPKTEPRQKQG